MVKVVAVRGSKKRTYKVHPCMVNEVKRILVKGGWVC